MLISPCSLQDVDDFGDVDGRAVGGEDVGYEGFDDLLLAALGAFQAGEYVIEGNG